MPKNSNALLDANLILRFIRKDNPEQAAKVAKLLRKRINYTLTSVIVSEIIWTLTTYYQLHKLEIIIFVKSLINLDNIICNKNILESALNIWSKNNISWVDSYLVAISLIKNQTIYTFDKKLGKVPGIKVKTP